MTSHQSRLEFLKQHPHARAWAALDVATNRQKRVTPGPIRFHRGQFAGKRAIVIGSGVGGLTTAYELLAQRSGMEVTVLEARGRTGGRCMSLRTGDTLTEDQNDELFGSPAGQSQVIRFQRPRGDAEPYLNAGPGRIPSSHKRLLSYLRDFGVPLEVYVMNSGANLVRLTEGALSKEPLVYRRLEHNTRGWLAQMVHAHAEELLKDPALGIPAGERAQYAERLRSLMVSFGELTPRGKYVPTSGEEGLENARSRAGFEVLPGVSAGHVAEPLSLASLLNAEFWGRTRFYQPVDFLWQPTLFQPVGGMDRVQHAFAQQVAALGGTIHLSSPVASIDWDAAKREFVIGVSQVGTKDVLEYRADYCFCNMAMPFLKRVLSDRLQGAGPGQGFEDEFKRGLAAVYDAQFSPSGTPDVDGYVPRFLANTTKVGWQADRTLWQGSVFGSQPCSIPGAETTSVPDSEVGVVPIFGGISWTQHEIVQIWYPSTGYHDKKGVLTGAYNFSDTAYRWGKLPIAERLERARAGASGFGKAFAEGLEHGVAIAWQNMPHIKGGWAQWHEVQGNVQHFNNLSQGTGVHLGGGEVSLPVFFVVGDQLSSLPGWQEGAIASALNALSRVADPTLAIPHLSALPDTRLIVEGV